jgi:hypothetical protein
MTFAERVGADIRVWQRVGLAEALSSHSGLKFRKDHKEHKGREATST